MSKQKTAPRIPLYSERREPESKDNYIYGSEDASEKENDSLAKALSRYLSDSGPANKKVSVRLLHTLSGVSKSAIRNDLCDLYRFTAAPYAAGAFIPQSTYHDAV